MSQVSVLAFLRRLRTACVLSVVIAVALVGGAYWVAARKLESVPKVKMDTSVLRPGGNYLLIGSDSRAFVEQNPSDAQHFGSAQTQSGQTVYLAAIDNPNPEIA